jgi:Tfp pilus assembly protein FimT
MAYKVFSNGAQLPASDLNTYLMSQAVISFASSAARASAIASPVEGQLTWLEDSNKYQYYDGSSWVDLFGSALSTKTANYSTVATDSGSTIVVNSASNLTITVDNNLTAGQRIDFVRKGTGTVTFAAGTGVTLNSKSGNLKISAQYAAATVLCDASGSYILIGDLGA